MSNGHGPAVAEAVSVSTDAQLSARAAAGEQTAFEELYRRHANAAWRVAQAVTGNAHDAADAVAEAFARVLKALPAGRLNDGSMFRSYLLASTRNAAIDVLRRGSRTRPTDVIDLTERPSPSATPSERAVDALDASLVATAFRSLPERWRSVLWLTEVEGMPARQVAELLGVSPNGVAQLAVRARAGLRERYLQAHLQADVDQGCRYTVDRLGAYVAGGLAPRDIAKVDQHLAGCEACRGRLAELEDVGSSLRRIVLPLPLALGGAAFHKWQLASSAGTGLRRLVPSLSGPTMAKLQKPLVAASAGLFALGVIGATVVGRPSAPLQAAQGPTPATAPAAPPVLADFNPTSAPLQAATSTPLPDLPRASSTPAAGSAAVPAAPTPAPSAPDVDLPRPGTGTGADSPAAPAPTDPLPGLPLPPLVPPGSDPGDGGDVGDGSGGGTTDAAIEIGVDVNAGPVRGEITLGDACQGGSLGDQSLGCNDADPAPADDDTVLEVETGGTLLGENTIGLP